MRADRQFQEVFGRSIQTKILDFAWKHKDEGINIKQLSGLVRNSYVYTVKTVDLLVEKGLLDKETVGRESIIRPNLKSPVVKNIAGNGRR